MGVMFMAGGKVPRLSALPAICATVLFLLLGATAHAADCPLPPGETARVAAVVSGDSVVLESGVPVRLAAVSVPSATGASFPAEEAARAALSGLVLGRLVEVRSTADAPDRYGRRLAQLFLAETPDVWVQARLAEEGLVVVRTSPGDASCARALLAVEALAREARAGIWADPAFAPLPVDAPSLRGLNGVYAVVEGRVVSVGRTERSVYLNFGFDWSTDFTAVIATETANSFALDGIAVDALSGHQLRLRGWIEDWDGPSMRLDHAEQIEILD